MRFYLKILAGLLLFFVAFAGRGICAVEKPILLRLEGTVNPVIAEHIERHLKNLEAPFAIIKMDTPGGLMDSMRQIIKAMEACPKPVVLYVGDSGARAASAGAFIVMASDLTVMARGTNIGAAHPVALGGDEEAEGAGRKAVEDARSFIKSLAEKHSRNAEWAQKAVTESASITAAEAREMNVVEYLVENFAHLKEKLEGAEISKGESLHRISFESGMREINLSLIRRFLNYISHPNIAYLLLILGIYGLIYEAASPGIEFGAVLGGISLLLAMLALQIIPVNTVGILLIVLGGLLMLLDVWTGTDGILTAGGIVSFFIGSLMLFDVADFPLRVDPVLIYGATAAIGAFFLFAAAAGVNIQNKKVSTGIEGMLGLKGEVIEKLSPEGKVYLRGEIWTAVSPGEKLRKGEKVVVEEVRGSILKVRKMKKEEF